MSESDVPWVQLLSAGDQPPRAAWGKLIAELKVAAAELQQGKGRDVLAAGVLPILRALMAIDDYLSASAALKTDPRLRAPLAQLIAAIYMTQVKHAATEEGRKPPQQS